MDASRKPLEARPPRMSRLSRLPVFLALEGKQPHNHERGRDPSHPSLRARAVSEIAAPDAPPEEQPPASGTISGGAPAARNCRWQARRRFAAPL